jgi:hypothetical protein
MCKRIYHFIQTDDETELKSACSNSKKQQHCLRVCLISEKKRKPPAAKLGMHPPARYVNSAANAPLIAL